jgi:hypothetical protein
MFTITGSAAEMACTHDGPIAEPHVALTPECEGIVGLSRYLNGNAETTSIVDQADPKLDGCVNHTITDLLNNGSDCGYIVGRAHDLQMAVHAPEKLAAELRDPSPDESGAEQITSAECLTAQPKCIGDICFTGFKPQYCTNVRDPGMMGGTGASE